MGGRTTPKGPQGWKPVVRPATYAQLRKGKKPVYLDIPVVLDSDLARSHIEAQQALQQAEARRDVLARIAQPWPDDDASRSAEMRAAMSRLAAAQVAVDDAQAALDEAREAVEPSAVNIRVRSRGGHVLQELRDTNPPTDDQVAEHKREWEKAVGALPDEQRKLAHYSPLDVNPDTYQAALLAACAVVPEMTFEEARDLLEDDNYSESEIFAIVEGCKAVQLARPQVDLGKASGRKPVSA